MLKARAGIVGGLVLLLVIGVAYFWLNQENGEYTAGVERDSSGQAARAIRHHVDAPIRPELSWMYERGIEPRRIAGQVTIKGSPAANFELSLRSEALMHSELMPTRTRSDAEGRFDFGLWPATQYAVVAGGGAYELAIEPVDLANPLVDSEAVLLRLEPCSREGVGTISSLYGEPIADATFSVVTAMRPANRFTVASQAIDPDGSFRLCLSRDRTDIRIDAPGFAETSLYEYEGHRMPKDGWQVRLLPAGAIRGKFVDSQMKGIAGGRIGIFRKGVGYNLSVWQHVISDADGSFVFTAVGPGKYQVAADHADYMLETEWQTVSLAPGEKKDGVVVTGGDCRKISGTVVTEDGVPVVGADVWGSARSQADGSFVIKCALYESFELEMRAYQALVPQVAAGTEDIDNLTVEVASPSSLRGRIVSGDEPAANAAITLRSEDGSKRFQRTRSDGAGQYRFRAVVPGQYLLKASSEQGMSVKASIQVADSALEHDLMIEDGTQVSGRVRTEDGMVLAGIAVRFISDSGGESSARTTQGGRFQTTLSASESYKVSLRYAPPQGSAWPRIEAGAPDVTLDLRVAGDSQRLSGQVVYEDDSPVSHARVTVFPSGQDLQVDEGGYFDFQGLPPSPFAIYAVDLMGLKGSVENIVASNGVAKGVRIVIERGASIVGTITNGMPACKVRLRGKERRNTQGASFVFDDLEPGAYTIEAQCEHAVAAKITTVSAGDTAELSLKLETGLSVDGIVKRFPTGEPIAGLECTAGMAKATTDSSGRFRLAQIAPQVPEIRCRRYQPMAFGRVSLSTSKEAHQEVEVWGIESSLETASLTKDSGRLGARLLLQDGHLVFTELQPSGACAELGILEGDVLLTVAGIEVLGNEKVVEFYLQTLPTDEAVTLEIRRGEKRMVFDFGL